MSLGSGPRDGCSARACARAHAVRVRLARRVPFLVITYLLTYYDKTVQSQAAIFTFLKDTHLAGNQYRNVSLIFYVGYIAGSYPCSYAAQKFHVGRACGVMCFLWGVTVMLTGECQGVSHGLSSADVALGRSALQELHRPDGAAHSTRLHREWHRTHVQ